MACCATSTAPTYAVGGNDTSMVRTGPRSLLLLMAGNRRMTRFGTTPVCGGDAQSACSPQLANAVNFVIRSDDCGDTWTPTIAVDNGDGAGGPAPGASGLCGNLDFARVYVDPWKSSAGHNFIYIFGYTGPSCCGGVDRAVLYRSDDGGATFVKKATFPRSTGAMGLTSYPDGTTVVFGCSDDQMGSPPHKGPRVLWSYGNDDTNFDNPPSTPTGGGYFDGDILPACATTDYLGGVFHFGPDMSSMSRMLDGSNSDSYNYFRFAYQTTIDDRNGVAVGYGVVPRFGSGAAAHMVQAGTIATASAGSDILRASFIDPDQFAPNVPNTSLLFWEEIDASLNHNVRYSAVTGFSNYTPPRYFNLNGGSNNPWTRPADAWIGEYDRGSYYFDNSQSTASTNVLNYFADWTQSHASCPQQPNAYVHYNTAQVTEPTFSGGEVSSALNMATDPGAAKLVTSGGVTQIHVFAADADDAGGKINRIIYSDDTGTWSGWNVVGDYGVTDRAVAAVSWGPGRLDVFGIGVDDNMIYHYPEQDQVQLIGGWGWESLGGPTGGFTEAPSVASQGSGKLFIAGTGTGGDLYYKTWDNGWSDWESLGGGVAFGAPAAFSLYPGRVDVMVRGTDNNLWQYIAADDGSAGWEGRGYWNNLAWSGLGGGLTASPSVAVRDDSRVDVFAGDGYHPYVFSPWDTDGHTQIMHAWYDNGWSDWHSIGGIIPSDNNTSPYSVVAGVGLSTTRVRLFNRGMNNHLWWMQNGS